MLSQTSPLGESSQGSDESQDVHKGWRTEATPCSNLCEPGVLRRGKGGAQWTPYCWENCKVSDQKWFTSFIQREESPPPPRQITRRLKRRAQNLGPADCYSQGRWVPWLGASVSLLSDVHMFLSGLGRNQPKTVNKTRPVLQACNPSFSGGWSRKVISSRSVCLE